MPASTVGRRPLEWAPEGFFCVPLLFDLLPCLSGPSTALTGGSLRYGGGANSEISSSVRRISAASMVPLSRSPKYGGVEHAVGQECRLLIRLRASARVL